MYQIVLQRISNYSLDLVRLGTLFSLRRKYDALRLQFAEHPSCGDLRPLLRFAARLPNASLKHGYSYGFRLYDQLAENRWGLAKRLGLLNGEHISVYHDLKQLVGTRLCATKRLMVIFSQYACGVLNFVAEYLTSLNGLRHNYLLNIARLCRGLGSKFPAFCVP